VVCHGKTNRPSGKGLLKAMLYCGMMPQCWTFEDSVRPSFTAYKYFYTDCFMLWKSWEMRGTGLTIFVQNIFFTAGFFVCSPSFFRFRRGECKLRRNFFNGFSFLFPIVSLLYNCSTIVHVTLHSLE